MRRQSQCRGFDSTGGFVLAGGRSSRMGFDKALALFGGIPLIQVALSVFAEAQIPAQIAGSRSNLDRFGDAIPDLLPESGPLGGIHAALSRSPAEWNLFLPVDLPLMPSSVLTSLVQRARLTQSVVTALALNGRLQPFPVVLHRRAAASVAACLTAGKFTCRSAWETIPAELGGRLDAVSVETLLQCGQCTPGRRRAGLPPVLWFQGANTPEELARLNRSAPELRPRPAVSQQIAPQVRVYAGSQVI